MRSFKIIALTICLINLLAYLSGSFLYASFDISTWSKGARAFMVFVCLFVDFIVAEIILDTQSKYEE